MGAPEPPRRFDPTSLAGLDEPVRRFFTHAIAEGAPLPEAVRLTMAGRIKVSRWLPFAVEQEMDGRSFVWRARVGWRRLAPLQVVDRFANGLGEMDGRLFGRVPLFHADDADTSRSAAGRAALESIVFAPVTALPERGVTWRAEGEDLIVAGFRLPPERPEVHVRIGEGGAIRSVSALRWGNAGQKAFDYIPCGCDAHGERRVGDFVVPSAITVGRWFGTPRYTPFFEARSSGLRPVQAAHDRSPERPEELSAQPPDARSRRST